jgi:uncharacterized phage protein gp47/JayE
MSRLTCEQYYKYFTNQSGRGVGGFHYNGIGSVYKARRGIKGFGYLKQPMSGAGFGSFVGSILRKALPFLKNTVFPAVSPLISQVKNTIQDAAANVVEDVIQGENVGSSIKRNVISEGQKLLAKVPSAFSGILTKDKSDKDISQPSTDKPATSQKVQRKRPKKVSFRSSPAKRGRGSFSRFPGLALI